MISLKATEALTAKSRLASELSDAQSSPSSSAPLQDNSEAVADLESQLAATRMQAEKVFYMYFDLKQC